MVSYIVMSKRAYVQQIKNEEPLRFGIDTLPEMEFLTMWTLVWVGFTPCMMPVGQVTLIELLGEKTPRDR